MSIDVRDSLALLFSKATRHIGFMPDDDEYEVMGLGAVNNQLLGKQDSALPRDDVFQCGEQRDE
ncbi:hypothetical protein [Lentzea sp. NPDC059081]|uniref:hypothetical protein n=1 Tax=Lentzea sp. NPDC059081 TaxID=3346719 RepID=UPI00368AA575